MRWLGGIIDSVDMNLRRFKFKLWKIVKDRGVWHAAVRGVAKSRTQLNDFTFTFFHFHTKKLLIIHLKFQLSCCCSVTQSCPTLCNPMNGRTPGLPVIHQHPEFTQTHVHSVISSSVVPFSSCPQYLTASESFPMSQLFA